jgi:hypothetical protein
MKGYVIPHSVTFVFHHVHKLRPLSETFLHVTNTLPHAVHLFASNRMDSADRSSVICPATRGSRSGDGAAFQTSIQGGITAEEDTAAIAMGTAIAEIFPGGV